MGKNGTPNAKKTQPTDRFDGQLELEYIVWKKIPSKHFTVNKYLGEESI